MDTKKFEKLAKLIRYHILSMTTAAGSGHPTSSLSAVELMAGLMFGGSFRFDLNRAKNKNNDRLIFSKGHASPLFYSLWAVASSASGSKAESGSQIKPPELLTLRKFGSRLEGHPTPAFPYTEAATGSLGQGLSVGVGMALNAKYLDHLPYRTYVLMGDSEMAEGSVWEAMQIAAHYRLDNLVAVLDVNRLGQRGETMDGYNLRSYERRAAAFGWKTFTVNGHNFKQVVKAYRQAQEVKSRPVMIIAKTVKGKGLKLFENKDGWHGKALSPEELKVALKQLGPVDKRARGTIEVPARSSVPSAFKAKNFPSPIKFSYKRGEQVSTRKAYGQALARIAIKFRDMAVLDGEVSNSTYSEIFKAKFPDQFFEMYIAEQNMVGAATGLALRGKMPFVSTFAAFFTRAFDQIRMASYSDAHIVFCGSHAGVSIGEDGVSQMGLEDLGLFRSIRSSIVLYPGDAASCDRLVEECARYRNICYLRTTRKDTPVIYGRNETFPIGGSKVLKKSRKDAVTVVAAGVTLYEALAAYEELKKEGINIRVIDLYSVKPLDKKTLLAAAKETKAIITVEDHYPQGGIGEAVAGALSKSGVPVHILAVEKLPRSGKPQELLDYEGIDASAIVIKVKEILNGDQKRRHA